MTNVKRSSILKMINYEIPDDRKLNSIPKPYKSDCSPYKTTKFTDNTIRKTEEKFVLNILNICKVIIIGDVCVGKTSIVNRFCHKMFDTNYKSTIGVDFEVEKFSILNVDYTLQIWDTAGQERFKSIAQSYYRGSHVIITVFDFTNLQTLSNCKNWLKEALNTSSTKPFVFLVGSKQDLLNKFAFKNAELNAIRVANNLNAEYWPVSSKTGLNIDKLFGRIAVLSFNSMMDAVNDFNRNVEIGSILLPNKKTVRDKSDHKCGQFKCN